MWPVLSMPEHSSSSRVTAASRRRAPVGHRWYMRGQSGSSTWPFGEELGDRGGGRYRNRRRCSSGSCSHRKRRSRGRKCPSAWSWYPSCSCSCWYSWTASVVSSCPSSCPTHCRDLQAHSACALVSHRVPYWRQSPHWSLVRRRRLSEHDAKNCPPHWRSAGPERPHWSSVGGLPLPQMAADCSLGWMVEGFLDGCHGRSPSRAQGDAVACGIRGRKPSEVLGTSCPSGLVRDKRSIV